MWPARTSYALFMAVFGPALAELSKSSHPWRDPEVFQDYCRKHGVSGKTASLISVQDFVDSTASCATRT